MIRIVSAIALGLGILSMAHPAAAQITTPSTRQCMTGIADRTIYLCDQGGSTLGSGTVIRAYAASSAGIKSFQLWVDGVKRFDTGPTSQTDKGTLFAGAGTNDVIGAPGKWHRFVFIATDSVGQFRKTAYYYLVDSMGATSPCTPSSDGQIKICSDLKDGDVVPSPLSVTYAARSTEKITGLGVRSEDSSNGGAMAGFDTFANIAGGTSTLYLPKGTHKLTFGADRESGSLTKQVTITVK